MQPTAISAIEAMVAPVVLITTGSILSNGLFLIYGAVNDRMRQLNQELAVLVLSVIAIAAAVTGHSDAIAIAALALVLAGTLVILGGLVFAARSLAMSTNAIEYEVSQTMSMSASR